MLKWWLKCSHSWKNVISDFVCEINMKKNTKLGFLFKRFYSPKKKQLQFGFIFDVDGVIARGTKVLPEARNAFSILRDEKNKLRVPVVFVTNAGNCLRSQKAEQLSKWLELKDSVVRHLEPIEAIMLLGEPVRWETSLQLIMDVFITNGFKDMPPRKFYYPHIPLLACNMDLQWMSEASIPRFGHGAFLLCLEELYKKICGVPLVYTTAVGKPSETTFHYAFSVLKSQSKHFGTYPKRVYAVGDNIFTDVYGANLYDNYVKNKSCGTQSTPSAKALSNLILRNTEMDFYPDTCVSILVETGVYNQGDYKKLSRLDHHPRDYSPSPDDLRPKMVCKDVEEAVSAVFKLES